MDVPQRLDHHAAMHRQFRWAVPTHFNVAQTCCTRWAQDPDHADRTAVLVHASQGQPVAHSYAALAQAANRLSNGLASLGVQRGDPVALALEQGFEAAVAFMAVLQMGAVAVPLSVQLGPEALQYRLRDSEAGVVLAGARSIQTVRSVRARCPHLRTLVGMGLSGGDLGDEALAASADMAFEPQSTLADDPAVLLYTGGTTGQPKGALIAHRALLGSLSGFICAQNWFGFDPDDASAPSAAVCWTPADWASVGGLLGALWPTLYFGRPIVASPEPFTPAQAFELLQRHGVTHACLSATTLKSMMKAFPEPRRQFRLVLQALIAMDEPVGAAVVDYCQEQLGAPVNETYGQTEVYAVVGHCALRPGGRAAVGWPERPGSMGRAYPGHRVAVLDDEDAECPVGVTGELAVHRLDRHAYPDPALFLGYWKHEATTHARFSGDWWRTGDLARRDADGYFWYQGRADDVFISAGHRIGPGEVERCLLGHPAVAQVAVVPKPDAALGAVVKAYAVLTAEAVAERGHERFSRTEWEARLVAELQAQVRDRLAPYELPHEIEFVDELPTTLTGKLLRAVLRQQEAARARAALPYRGA